MTAEERSASARRAALARWNPPPMPDEVKPYELPEWVDRLSDFCARYFLSEFFDERALALWKGAADYGDSKHLMNEADAMIARLRRQPRPKTEEGWRAFRREAARATRRMVRAEAKAVELADKAKAKRKRRRRKHKK